MTAPNKIDNPNVDLHIPSWINLDYFKDIVAKDVPDMVDIVNFTPTAAIPPGSNFTSAMLRLHFDLRMKDGSLKYKSYIFKTMLENDRGGKIINELALFPKELQMYCKYLPAFENLYKKAGWYIQLAPRCLLAERKDNIINFMFEDLQERDFKNANRLEGFDMVHMQHSLRKLAEFHAASAVYEEQNGAYPEDFQYSFIDTRHNLSYLQSKYNTTISSYKKAMALWNWDKAEEYIQKLPTFDQYWKCALASLEPSPNFFNVLNHCDFWSSNIMFAYLPNGELDNTLLLDFQICKWGSPAEDLLFFLTTSPNGDIILNEHDSFVVLYHARLVECLRVLGYRKSIPSLRSIHQDMFDKRNTYYAFFACINHVPIGLFPADKDSSIQNFARPDELGENLRMKAFTNPNFVKIVKELFKFYHQRGIFNFEDYD